MDATIRSSRGASIRSLFVIPVCIVLVVSGIGCDRMRGAWLALRKRTSSPPVVTRPTTTRPAATRPAAPSTQAVEDEEQKDFSRLLLDRPPVPLTVPEGGLPPREPVLDLPVPGSALVDRLCRLERNPRTGWYVLRFLRTPDHPPAPARMVLFSSLLEQFEYLADQTPRPLLRISGENTVYKKWGFVLLTEPPMIASVKKPPAPPEPPAPSPASRPAAASTQPDKPRSASAKQIRGLLRGEDPGRPLPVPASPRVEDVQPAPSVAPAPTTPALSYGMGELVVDRLVRLVPEREEGWLLARFESDNTLQQPPLRLLPCRRLEEAEVIAAAAKIRTAKFRVSGLITQYKGRRYLLLRKLIREREMGQF